MHEYTTICITVIFAFTPPEKIVHMSIFFAKTPKTTTARPASTDTAPDSATARPAATYPDIPGTKLNHCKAPANPDRHPINPRNPTSKTKRINIQKPLALLPQ